VLKSLLVQSEDACDNPVCATCNCEIPDSHSRVISFADKSGIPIVLNYHYFFPCWDPLRWLQEYPYSKIISAGYFCDSEVLKNPKMLRNLKNNLDLWV
jgi:hypothetical protein